MTNALFPVPIEVYKYKGTLFEIHYAFGAWPLKKDYSLKVRKGKKFDELFDEFLDLPWEDKVDCMIGVREKVFGLD